jgi:hypothetical protein
MGTTVRRRLIFIKKTKNPHAPLPKRRRSSSDEMVGEKAKPFAPLAAPARPVVREAGWRRFAKPALAALGGVGLLVGGIVMVATSGPASRDYAEPEIRSVVSRPAVTTVRVGNPTREDIAPVAMMERPTPTDASFLASAHVRRKVSLPNISGNCKIGEGGQDMADCLRRAAAQQ